MQGDRAEAHLCSSRPRRRGWAKRRLPFPAPMCTRDARRAAAEKRGLVAGAGARRRTRVQNASHQLGARGVGAFSLRVSITNLIRWGSFGCQFVLHFIDNTSALAGLISGSSRSWDSARLIHTFQVVNVSVRAKPWFSFVRGLEGQRLGLSIEARLCRYGGDDPRGARRFLHHAGFRRAGPARRPQVVGGARRGAASAPKAEAVPPWRPLRPRFLLSSFPSCV